MNDYEKAVRYSRLYIQEISNIINKANKDMKKIYGDDFIGLVFPTRKIHSSDPELIPAFKADSPSDNAVFINMAAGTRIYSTETETGCVLEYVGKRCEK